MINLSRRDLIILGVVALLMMAPGFALGIAITPGSRLPPGCDDGAVLMWDGQAWTCAAGVVVDDSGNVGIGEPRPEAKLEVAGQGGNVAFRLGTYDDPKTGVQPHLQLVALPDEGYPTIAFADRTTGRGKAKIEWRGHEEEKPVNVLRLSAAEDASGLLTVRIEGDLEIVSGTLKIGGQKIDLEKLTTEDAR